LYSQLCQKAIIGTHLFGVEPIACPDLKQAQDEVLGLSNGPRMMELLSEPKIVPSWTTSNASFWPIGELGENGIEGLVS